MFRYRGVEMMALLGIGTLFALAVIGACVGEWLHPNVKNDLRFMVGLAACLALPTVWGWACLVCSRAETDDMGITQVTPFGRKYLPWFAVADYREWQSKEGTGYAVAVVGQNNVRVVLWSSLSGYADLKAEIKRYASAPRTGFAPPP